MCAAVAALLVTLVALLGGVGLLPVDAPAAAATGPAGTGQAAGRHSAALTSMAVAGDRDTQDTQDTQDTSEVPEPTRVPAPDASAEPPAGSGSGRRVVFDIGDQRVWLVDAGGTVLRTYLVSGSLTDNLKPGSYEVFSRSRWAVGIDDSGTMEYFVRFAHGENAAIGFHSIPTKDGHRLQTRAQLGSPQSHGCIRQARPEARRLWAFAPVGTKVVVTA